MAILLSNVIVCNFFNVSLELWEMFLKIREKDENTKPFIETSETVVFSLEMYKTLFLSLKSL